MSCGLVHASYSLPELQAVKLTFFAPLLGPIFFSSLSGRIKVSNNFTSETSVFVKLSIKSENFVVCRSFSRIRHSKKVTFVNVYRACHVCVMISWVNAAHSSHIVYF